MKSYFVALIIAWASVLPAFAADQNTPISKLNLSSPPSCKNSNTQECREYLLAIDSNNLEYLLIPVVNEDMRRQLKDIYQKKQNEIVQSYRSRGVVSSIDDASSDRVQVSMTAQKERSVKSSPERSVPVSAPAGTLSAG